jgi:hypothetical protein
MARVIVALLWFAPLITALEAPTADLARRIVEAGLDAEECYRVRDLHFAREDVRFYLTDGHLIFGKPVDGLRMTAVFSADVERGDAEILIFPPHRSERMSLAAYTGSPNFSEHFRSAVMVFTDTTYEELLAQVRAQGMQKSSERGVLLVEDWNSSVRNFSGSFQIRLVADRLSGNPKSAGFFYGALAGVRLGNFDVLYDPRAEEQITLGQVVFRDDRTFFDVWTRFQARSFRTHAREVPGPELAVSDYRIDATFEPDLRLRVRTRATISPGPEARRALAFFVSRQMRITEATIDGVPAEVFQPESLRASLIRGGSNDPFLVVPAAELQPGRSYEVEFRHEGAVVSDAGNGVYFVGARGSWYPNRGMQFARYDLTFRYPKTLDLVSTGEVVEDRTEEEWRITRRKTDSPIRLAGFNLGNYERQTASAGGYTVELYANRRLESALEKPQRVILMPRQLPPGPRGKRPPGMEAVPLTAEAPPPSPAAQAERLATEIAEGLEFMASHFGPLPLKSLTVSPIPGAFGQGFPGLIYLSTMSYLEPKQMPVSQRNHYQQTFFSEILAAHETAHQWWGTLVTSASYQDDWLMEALANYSALLVLEKRKGPRAIESILERYRENLLAKSGDRTMESAGPIVWGSRLENSQVPGAWRTIIYEKGSWILHMLRRRIGDQGFLSMLGELRRNFEYKPVHTENLRLLAARHLPPKSPDPQLEAFFDQWVYGTGIPTLRLSYSLRGKAPAVRVSGTVTQSDAGEDFSAHVPIELQFGKGKPVTHWVRTSDGPMSFSVTVRQVPSRVLLDPGNSILAVKR